MKVITSTTTKFVHDVVATGMELAISAILVDEDSTLADEENDIASEDEEISNDVAEAALIMSYITPPFSHDEIATAIQHALVHLGEPCHNRFVIKRLVRRLDLGSDGILPFLQLFGPLRYCIERANGLLFDKFGRSKPGFWGVLAKCNSETIIMSHCQQNVYLVRICPKFSDKLVITYSRGETVKHCGLTNKGESGYAVRHGSETIYYSSPVAFIAQCIRGDAIQTSQERPFIEPPINVDEEVDMNTPSLYRAEGDHEVHLQISDLLFEGEDGSVGNGELLDHLLRQGAENFRNGRRGEAALFFSKVIRLADKNLQVGTNDNHIAKSAWCKCLLCSSIRAKARSLGNLGHVYSDRKDTLKAVRLYQESLPLLRELGMWKQEPNVLSSLTTCAITLQDPELGIEYGLSFLGTVAQHSERLALLQRLEDLECFKPEELPSHSQVSDLILEGDQLYSMDSSPIMALPLYVKALQQARCIQDDILEVSSLIRLGACLYMMHRLRDAVVVFERAVLLLRNNNILLDNRELGKARVELHNLALAFAKQASNAAGWTGTIA